MRFTENLQADTASGKPLVVMFSSSSCGYCARLEEEQFVPLLISGQYRGRILIRKLSLDAGRSAVDVDGTRVATDSIAGRYGVLVTPTVLLLGPGGAELAERLVGIGLPDFYGAYLDRSIRAAERALDSDDPTRSGS